MTSPRDQARRALKQCLELERAFGADMIPRRGATRKTAEKAEPAAAAPATAGERTARAPAATTGTPRPARIPPAHPHAAPTRRDPAEGLPDDLRERFLALRTEALACTKCGLHKSRTQVVFGVGTPRAALMFVGEAPGADEDAQGEPFVGRAGQLLTKTLAELGVRRDEVYIGNILKCRPPDNRKPEPDEVSQCFPYLRRQVDIIRPKVLCALGAVAAQGLLGNTEPISRIRGRYFDFPWIRGLRVFPTFHPAYLLRSPWEMPKFKQDLRLILADLKPSGS
jgi:DNA polymerase